MPALVFKTVKSFSSEDPLFPATNLLSSTTSTGKKWKCQSAGEDSAEVILELENSSTITAIDIGNEHSAFVEVFVSKNGASEFQQILLTSSFMTPLESRNSDPINRVRCFSKSALVEKVVESKCKWDLVKVICTQSFNKRVQYGLSFIKLHTTDAKESNDTEITLAPQNLFGMFKIRKNSPDSDGDSPQSLFSRWKGARNSADGKGMSPVAAPLSAAAAIRNASTTDSLKNRSPQVNRAAVTPKPPKRTEHRPDPNVSNQADDEETITKKNQNRSELMYEDEDDKPNEKLDKVILKERERLEREKNVKKNSEKKGNSTKATPAAVANERTGDSSQATSKASKNDTSKTSSSKESDRSATTTIKTKRQSSPVPAATPPAVKKINPSRARTYKPFRKLLEGVVLVISGIQNPNRANIRQQALDMGAKYKPDWESSCTHLICAFKNTPKYNQVHGHGKIISKDWISECHKRKMRIPWRRYALDDDDGDASESEGEIFDESTKLSETTSHHSNKTKAPQPSESHASSSPTKTSKSPSKSAIVLSDDDPASDNESLDRYNLNSSRVERNSFVSSGSDTEDEIRRVLEKKQTSSTDQAPKTVSSDDIYNATTEEEEEGTATSKSPAIAPLPEWFKGKRFYLSRNVSSTDEIKLKRFIEVYGGEITLIASESDYILSNAPKATSTEYKGEVVKPLWIFECNESETLLPTRRYKFSNW